MNSLLSVLALWMLWTLADLFIVFPKWVWYVIAINLGVGAQLLLNSNRWYLGIGLGGAVVVLYSLTDLILVASDLLVLRVQASKRRGD